MRLIFHDTKQHQVENMTNKDGKITGIEFRGIIIGSFREYRDVKEKVMEQPKPKPAEEPKQPEPEDIRFDTNYIQSIIGSYDDWKSFKAMVRGWAGIKPAPKPEGKADVSDHDTIMKMSSG